MDLPSCVTATDWDVLHIPPHSDCCCSAHLHFTESPFGSDTIPKDSKLNVIVIQITFIYCSLEQN